MDARMLAEKFAKENQFVRRVARNAESGAKKIKDGVKSVAKKAEAEVSLKPEAQWNMDEGGSVIEGREYSQHALERMAPDTPSVKAELSRRAEKLASEKGYKLGTERYSDFCKNYVDPRNIPPSVIEDVISNTQGVPGDKVGTLIHESADVRVVVNLEGKVVTVIPK